MIRPIDVIVFDVNETLSDMAPLSEAFTAAGAPAHLAPLWFSGILRDGFAATAAGGNTAFAEIAQDSAARLLSDHGVASVKTGVKSIMSALRTLDVHADVPLGVEALRTVAELVTLSNGPVTVAEALLDKSGTRQDFTRLLSVQDAPAWKPARAAYAYAADQCDTELQRMMLVAVHPWDLHGAHAAGMRTAWINRTGTGYPAYFARPDIEAPDLPSLASQLH